MFATTFFGHQGWMFRSEQACLLVDTLLAEEFGRAHALEYRVWPPRAFDRAAFPRVDALLLTHEHDDHFDIASLAQIDRRVPIYLSARSSIAGFRILEEMGFSPRRLVPGELLTVKDLEVLPLCADHVSTNTGDEWDTLPFLVRHAGGAGSFFSTVDVSMTTSQLEAARRRAPQPGLVGWTNNAQDWSHVATFLPERGDATEQFTQRMRSGHGQLSNAWGPPRGMLICAGGFSFYGAKQWLNGRVFCVDTERVCKTMDALYRPQRFLSTLPGQTVVMVDNKIKEIQDRTPFLGTAPREGWPSRARVPMKHLPDYGPATGRSELATEDLPRLRRRLDELAESLVGGALFKGLYSLTPAEAGGAEGRAPTFAFALRGGPGGERLCFEYDPSACAFSEASGPRAADPRARYLAGMECWAADLLAVLDGDLGIIGLQFGRCYLWNASERLGFPLFAELARLSHPLRRPADFLRMYRRHHEEAHGTEPWVLPAE